MKITKRKLLKNIIILAIWLGIWQVASVAAGLELLFASPVSVWKEFLVLIGTAEFYVVIVHSFFRITLGFLCSFFLALILGALAGRFPLVRDFLAPAMALMKSLPVAAFIIIILMWFSSENVSFIIGGMVVIPIVYTAVVQGILHMDQSLKEMAQVFHMSFGRRLRYIYFPQVYPFVESSAKVALGMCWKAGVSAEVIGLASNSIGAQMYYAKLYLLSADLFVWSMVVISLSVLFEHLFIGLMKVMKGFLAR